MNYHILTLFPEMVLDGLNTSIIGRAAGKGLLSIEAVNIRDYTKEKHGHVDDTPYGGGAGMVMQAAPVCDAYEALCERIGKRPRVLYMTPQGQTFNQKIAEELAQEEDLVFLCGHYEGIDERALELIVTDYLSVGEVSLLLFFRRLSCRLFYCIFLQIANLVHRSGVFRRNSLLCLQ